MNARSMSLSRCSGEVWARLEPILERFEDAWRSDQRPDLGDYLTGEPAERRLLLIELVHEDLEYRLKAGEAVRVEQYLDRFPELAAERDVVLELIRAEIQFRRRQEPGLGEEEYRERFPQFAAELAVGGQTPGRGGKTEASTVHYEQPSTNPGGLRLPRVPGDWPAFPDYEVEGVLGRGGMGVVLKARHRVLDRLVAIKLPLSGQLAGPAERDRFQREARAAARLRHPNICPIHEVGQVGEHPYLVMGFIRGATLRDWAHKQQPTPRQAAEVVAVLARAVSHAHEHGVIHRDIKPANVILDADTGQPVLMDFGLAKELSEQAVQMTQSGQVMGTPAYMAPEQAAGHADRVGPAADVYALGTVLYELLCGRVPFQGNVGEILRQVQTEEPPPPRRLMPRLHRDLETICLKAMAKDPARRYASAADLAEDLERFNAGEAIRARREGLAGKLWRRLRRRPALAVSVLGGVAALAAAVYFALATLQAARRAADLDALQQGIDAGLEKPAWTAAYLDDMEGRIEQLGRLAPDKAASARQRLFERLGDSIRQDFSFQKRPILQPGDVARVEAALALLAERAPSLARRLRREFADRRSALQQVIDLKPPFAGSGPETVFARQGVRAVGNTIVREAPPAAPREAIVFTTVPCQGDVELKGIFDRSWSRVPRLGLVLNATAAQGYTFLLTVEAPRRSGPGARPKLAASFEAARVAHAFVRLQIIRNGILVREQRLKAEDVFAGSAQRGGSLRLEAKSEGNRITFQLNARQPLEFRDVFPLGATGSGVFGLHWPVGVHVELLQAWRKARPTVASPLERGDEFHGRGQLDEALAEYRRQKNTSRSPEVGWESRYKEGICLVQLRNDAAAEPVFGEVATQAGNFESAVARHWSLLADCQLWLLYLRQKRQAEADAMLDKLAARFGVGFDNLALLLTPTERADVLTQYTGFSGNQFASPPAELVRRFERAAKARDLLDPLPRGRYTTGDHFWTKVNLLKAYRLAGQEEEARATAEEVLRDYGPDMASQEQHCWLLRARREYAQALAVLAREGTSYVMLVERARIHAAMNEWDQADKDLKEFFDQDRRQKGLAYPYFSAACLLEGFLHERRGNPAAAQAAWRRGVFQVWYREHARELDPETATRFPGFTAFLHEWILASLTAELTDSEAQQMQNRLSKAEGAGAGPAKLLRLAPLPGSVWREAWRSPRGRELARQIALRDLSYASSVRSPIFLLGAEMLHQNALPGPLTKDQEALLWQLVQDFYTAFLNRTIKANDVTALAFIFKGLPDLFGGWNKVARSLKAPVRGPLAYVIGCRYARVRGKPKEALPFFQSALKDAPAGSPLQRLVRAELARLKGK